MSGINSGIYIHIPFCVRKCNYCAFLSFSSSKEMRAEYVQALVNECKDYFTSNNIKCKADFTSYDTVYFGGGTPSVLDVKQIEKILNTVRDNACITDDAEITIEVNPGTLGNTEDEVLSKLRAYIKMGFNRLSMGVQSMNDNTLKYLGRIHSSSDVRRDYALARQAGFDNINLDLILSVPANDNPLQSALDDVQEIVNLGPEHISCYSLQLEEGTKFFEMYEKGEFEEISDELDREIYHSVCKYLKDYGYEHYEISNFAKPGYRSRHNSKYWDMSEYVGLGLGASGFGNGVRYTNTSIMSEFLDGRYISDQVLNQKHDNISETVFLGLRRAEGVRYTDVFPGNSDPRDAFWQYYADALEEAKNFEVTGHLVITDEGIRLTEAGIDISNTIMSLFV